MNKVEAEAEIVRLVKDIDKIREGGGAKAEKVNAIAELDAQIKEVKKITGQRKITGTMRL